jgi:sterol desaturase/sphingolipid hydroxylase (fatty acid hydroxylase superfamily)
MADVDVIESPMIGAGKIFAEIWKGLESLLGKEILLIAWQTLAALSLFFVIVLLVEWLTGRRIRRYLEAPFRTDLLYAILIVSGIYGLFQQPVINWIDFYLRSHLSFLYLNALQYLSAPFKLALFILVVDFCRYWKHRWLHSTPLLQTFHSIHHAPDNLNFLTTYRIHLIEYLIDGVFTLVPVVLLGLPPVMWLPLYLTLILYSVFLHSDLNVSFGWLDRIFVSPRFHATHHSSDRSEYDTNFGVMFSFWDVAFGTARFLPSRPPRYGLPKLAMPPSFFGQFFFPAKLIFRQARSKAMSIRSRFSLPKAAVAQDVHDSTSI